MKNMYIILVVAVFGLSACTDVLDIEPRQSISETIALGSDANVKAALAGAYDELGNGDLFGGNLMRDAELLAATDEIQWVGTFNAPREIYTRNMIPTNTDAQEHWLEGYETINIANNVLSALDVVNASDRNIVEGEALFIRALVMFDLVRLYALQYEAGQDNSQPGIPIVTTPTRGISAENSVSRASVEQVYSQIIADASSAVGKLPTANGIFASSGAANALLARVYLQQQDYANALTASNSVIESGEYSLLGNYADVFNRDENSSEDIFAIQVTTQDGVNNMNTFFSIPDFGGRDGDIDILQAHLDLYDAADTRLALFFDGNGATRSGKWNNQFGNVGLFRLAEMLLIRAECNLRLGSTTGATPLEDYNAVHERAGLDPAGSVSLDDVIYERRLELAHEGFRVHDLRRLKENVGTLPYDAPNMVFPIPARELEANPNLTQNPGY